MDWYNSNRSQKLFCIKKNVDPDILLLNSNNIYCELFCNFCNKAHFNEFKPLVLCVFFLQLFNFYLFTRSPWASGTTRANARLRLTAYVPTDALWLECTWEDGGCGIVDGWFECCGGSTFSRSAFSPLPSRKSQELNRSRLVRGILYAS